jgi:hypothetical protein
MMPLVRFITVLALVASLPAAEPAAEDADLPAPFEPTMAKELLEHPPFTRIVDLEGSLQLTGVAYVEGRPVATFVNRATQERMIVSEAPNALGWRIVEATPSNDLSDTEVQLMIGTEVVTMHYGDEQLTPGVAKKGVPTSLASSGGRSPDSHGMSRDGERVRTSSYLGENGRELYASLSSDARGKLKDALRAHIEKHPEQSMEQHSAYAQKTFNKLKNADSGTPSTKVPKGEKPKKKP